MDLTVPKEIRAWQMTATPEGGFDLREASLPVPELKPGEALVRIAGCGLCGTDIGFLYEGSPLSSPLPVTLGHEISGVVVQGSPAAMGRGAVLPTLISCGRCEVCRMGRFNRCLSQKMLGTISGPYGGYASHIVVPEKDLCFVPDTVSLPLAHLSVIADAVSTPYQAFRRVGLGEGAKVILIGVTGGLGAYAAQWAKHFGASVVVGIGRNADKLEQLAPYGVDLGLSTVNETAQSLRQKIWQYCRTRRINPQHSWTIVELSGSKAGHQLAFDLMNYCAKVVLVGVAHGPVSLEASRLVAFDGEIIGSWGCGSEQYPAVLDAVLSGAIRIDPFIETRGMRTIGASFEEMRRGRASLRRIVLTPDWDEGAA